MVSWSYVTMSQTLMAQRTQPWGLQPCSATAAAGLAVGVEALPPEEVLLPNQEAHKISGMKQRRAPPERGRPLGPDGPPAPLAPSLPSRGRERATLFQNSEVRRYPGTGRCITRSSLSDQLAFWRAGSGARAESPCVDGERRNPVCRRWVCGSEATPRERHWVRRGNGSSLFTHSSGYGQSGSTTCESVATASSYSAATYAQAVRGASWVRPSGEGPCPPPLAAWHCRLGQCHCTRIDSAMPWRGKSRRGGVLLPLSRCSARPTATGLHHKHGRCTGRARQEGPSPSLMGASSQDWAPPGGGVAECNPPPLLDTCRAACRQKLPHTWGPGQDRASPSASGERGHALLFVSKAAHGAKRPHRRDSSQDRASPGGEQPHALPPPAAARRRPSSV